ncbi:polysaccharide deacetylase family protein [Spirosoma sp.]|uniref:polysaccharide deacetylase family protein n=1 Tax=Spirosoma sp. TaxID=1899569 RepID=UPI003B3A4D98
MKESTNLVERLGYAKTQKLLIIHADDFGLAQSENAATITTLETGSVNSASIMVPCAWFPESAAHAKARPNADIGIHLTLTSEWKHYRWRPILAAHEVPSLVDEQGFMHDSVANLIRYATVEDIEKELRAQIERGIQFGITPSHLDSHMFSLVAKPQFLTVYLMLSREYKLPLLLNQDFIRRTVGYDIHPYITSQDVLVDHLYSAEPNDYEAGMLAFYKQTLQNLSPGLSEIILHPAYNNSEMQAITTEHPYWAADWRQYDFDFFTSAECAEIIQKEQIQLITWREIREKLF